MAKNFEFLVLFTSSLGFRVDLKMAEMMKDVNPKLKIAFVGPLVSVDPDMALQNRAAQRKETFRQTLAGARENTGYLKKET